MKNLPDKNENGNIIKYETINGTLTKTDKSTKRPRITTRCGICGEKDIRCIQIHHVDKNRKNNEIDNLLICCANCHLKLHNYSNGSNVKALIYKIVKINEYSMYKMKKTQRKMAYKANNDDDLLGCL